MITTVSDLAGELTKYDDDTLVVIGYEMSPEETAISLLREDKKTDKLFICSTKKKNYTMNAWAQGHSVGRGSGFIAGKWAGYTQALARVLELIPGGSLKDKIQALFDEAISTGKTT